MTTHTNIVQAAHAVTHELMALRGCTAPREINRGLCDLWANMVMSRAGGEARWLDSMINVDEFPVDDQPLIAHCILIFEGRYYDSEHLDGVEDVLILAGMPIDHPYQEIGKKVMEAFR